MLGGAGSCLVFFGSFFFLFDKRNCSMMGDAGRGGGVFRFFRELFFHSIKELFGDGRCWARRGRVPFFFVSFFFFIP